MNWLSLDTVSTEIASGVACGKSRIVADGIPHLRPFSVTADGRLTLAEAPIIPIEAVPANRRELRPGDILFNNTNSQELVGKSALVEANLFAAFSNHMTRIRVDTRLAEPAFIHRYLNHLFSRRYFEGRATRWVSQAAFGTSQLKAIEIPLPPLDEQRRIVGLLDRAAEIRRRADAARAKARAIIPALFLDMFGDPATNPKGWAVQALSDLADIGSGLTKGRKLNGTPTEPTPYLRVANVQADRLDLSEIKMIDATDDDRVRCRVLPGDLLMTEGGDLDKLGRCAMWQGEVDLCLHQNHIFRVRMGSDIIPYYARAFMQSEAARGYFLRVAKRTTGIASINKTQLGRLPVWVPPLPLQTAFAEQASRLDSLTRALDAAAAKADSMAAALSAEVFG
ncbi:restriction endonuclease subunit S [Xanthobacter autotrophicus DSM 597]|uniref:restriction endonuclease subunit S n=1 Tax=Xanthobacter wiegelii TaxID=3119913 RepID=UPI00372B408F